MKTIRGSLAIEGNSLSEGQVTALIEGKRVVAPVRELQEVRDAIKAYDDFMNFNPYKKSDLLKAHGVMTSGLVENPGHFRKGGVCVAGKKGVSYIAPPANMVPSLISDLFEWLKNSKDHALIKSSVFHYEFEFIHPFEDGNGRMGRFWQSRILSEWNPIFANLPIENMIWENQSAYYKAIEKATDKNDSGIFVEFMLNVIYKTLKEHSEYEPINEPINEPIKVVFSALKENPKSTKEQLSIKLNLSRATVTRALSSLVKQNKIERVGSNKTGYWKIINSKL